MNYLDKFEQNSKNAKTAKRNYIFTKEQSLAEEIWIYFGKDKGFQGLNFPRIMSLIKTKGYQFIFETFEEIKKGDGKNKKALFIWKAKQIKIDLK